jgi:predicted HicB family RNase H-like nuclease
VATAIRLDPEVHMAMVAAAAAAAAADHGRALNWLVNAACRDYLTRLLPASEVRLTREPGDPT